MGKSNIQNAHHECTFWLKADGQGDRLWPIAAIRFTVKP